MHEAGSTGSEAGAATAPREPGATTRQTYRGAAATTWARARAAAIVAAWIVAPPILGGCHAAERDAHAAPAKDTSTPVRLAPIEAGPVSRPIRGTGVVRLKSEADLSFKVGGVVAAVLVEEGAHVKRGQVLARLDPTEVDAALRQAKEASAKADRDLDRVKRLYATGAVPIAEQQNAETGAELARAGVAAAAFNAQRAAIVAPDDGRVDKRMIEPGEVVAPGRPVFHVSGRSKGAIVRIGLGDRDVLRVKEGDVAKVVLDAKPETPMNATVSQIATVATPGVGTFEVELRLDLPPLALLSGLTAKIEIAHEEPAAAVVPIGAIVDGRGKDAAVFVVDGDHGDRVKKVPVKVAFLLDGKVALADAPIPPSARVVEAGADALEDGARVRVVR